MGLRAAALLGCLACIACGGSNDAGSDAGVCLAPTGPTVAVSCPMGGAAETPMGGVLPSGTYDVDQYILWSSSCGAARTAGGTLVVTGSGATLDLRVSTLASPDLYVCQGLSYHPAGVMLDPSTGYTWDGQGLTIYEAAGAAWQRTSHWHLRLTR